MRISKLLITLIVINAAVFTTNAKDLGTKGHTYPIIEQPFLQMINERLTKVDMNKEQEKMTAVVKDRVNNPAAVEEIAPATKARVFYFDPTYTLDKDIILPCGKTLHKAGTKVNPLEHMELNQRLFFIDARQQDQIKWVKVQLNNNKGNKPNSKKLDEKEATKELIEDKIILIGGSVIKLKEELGTPHNDQVYFDQAGELTTKFGIKASPCIVEQEGSMLRIEEMKID